MTELSKEIFENFQIRKTQIQKTDFINFIVKKMEEKDIAVEVEQGGAFKNRNIVVGDLENAKVIFTAHYDTCAVLPFPNFLSPKNPIAYLIYTLLICIPFFFVSLLSMAVLTLITQTFFLSYIITLLIVFFLIYLTVGGKANKHTANDNTSGVITLCEIIEGMNHEQLQKSAFVFFDNEEVGLVGSSRFKKVHKNSLSDKLIINFDCVSDGDYIMLIQSKKARINFGTQLQKSFTSVNEKEIIHTKASTTLYPSDQMMFGQSVGVAAFKRNKLIGYYIDRIHTGKDVIFDGRNIDCLKNASISFVNEID